MPRNHASSSSRHGGIGKLLFGYMNPTYINQQKYEGSRGIEFKPHQWKLHNILTSSYSAFTSGLVILSGSSMRECVKCYVTLIYYRLQCNSLSFLTEEISSQG